MKYQSKIIAASILCGLFIWFAGAALDCFVFFAGHGTFLDFLLLNVVGHEVYMRSLILLIFTVFGFAAAKVLGRSRVAEEVARKAEKRLVEAQHLAKLGDFTWDVETGEATWSEALYDLLKYDRSEVIDYARVNKEIHHPDDLERITEWLNEAIVSGRTELKPNEYRLIRGDGVTIWVRTVGTITHREGMKPKLFATVQDITERKQAENALRQSEESVRKKLEAIESPDGDIGNLELSDLINIEAVQSVIDDLNNVTHIAMAIIDLDGKILVASGWQDICTKFHRANPDASKYCVESDTELTKDIEPGKSRIYRCKHNLYDLATPLMLGNRRVGNLFLGQFLYSDEDPGYEVFRQQAKRYGFDEKAYMEALDKVPRFTHDEIQKLVTLFGELAALISSMGYSNTKLLQSLEERKQAAAVLRENELKFRMLFNSGKDAIALHRIGEDNEPTNFIEVNDALCERLGYTRAEMLDMSPKDIDACDRLEQLSATIEVLLKDKQALFETEHIAKDGHRIPVEISSVLFHMDNHTVVMSVARDLTERKRAEGEVKKERDLARDYLNIAGSIIMALDVDGKVLLMNKKGCEVFGYKESEVVGKDWFEMLIPPAIRKKVRGIFDKITKGKIEGVEEAENYILTKGGDEVLVSWHNSLIRDEKNNIIGSLSSGVDITDRKRMEDELRSSKVFIDKIIDESPFATWISDEKGVMIRSNNALRRMINLSNEQLIGSYNILQDENIIENDLLPKVQRVFDEHEPVRFRMHWEGCNIKHADLKGGRNVYVDALLFPIMNPNGELTNVVCQCVDVTEEVHLEEARAESEKKFRTIFNQTVQYMGVLNTDGILLDANLASLSLMGVELDEVKGKPFEETPWWIHSPELQGLLKEAIRKSSMGENVKFEASHIDISGELHAVDFSLCPIKDEAGNVVYLIPAGHDITEQKKAENELRVYREHLEELVHIRTHALEVANKELETFSYSVSHDLRAPLRGIDGFSEMLMEDYGDKLDDDAVSYIKRIRRGAQRMGSLINDLLELSRITRKMMHVGAVDFSKIASEIASTISENDPVRNVTFRVEPDMSLTGDAKMIYVVMENIIGNAWKFTSKNETALIEIGSEEKDGEKVFFVRDDGAGFDMNYADKLFGVFQRLHSEKEFEGTGVGLATVERIIAKHGGRVWADGSVGVGATFYFSLPDDNYHLK
jgi:PAS domain S-box-containing protein